MFIVNQGSGSEFYIYTENSVSGASIRGSTLYSTNGYYDQNTVSAYNLILEDNVIHNFTSTSPYFLSANVSAYNCTFDDTQANISADYSSFITSGSQFSWTIPSNWPFLRNNIGYGKSLSWLLNNKQILRPFAGLTLPPNPGKNYDTYSNYPTGLFGGSRKDFKR
jgi:hypothetical protein